MNAIADLEGLLVIQMAGRDHLVAAPQFVAIAHPGHRAQDDTGTDASSG